MTKSQRDIEYEMSRFEEEITKLIPPTPIPTVQHVISAAPVSTYSIKPRSLGNMGMSTSIGNMGMPSSFSSFQYQQPMPQNPFAQPIPSAVYNNRPTAPPMIPKVVSDQSAAPKRDSAGNLIQRGPPQKPTTAAAAASAVAAQSGEADVKKTKVEEGKGGPKRKKFIRAAGGQTWEDQSLAEWNPDDFRLFCGDLGNEVNDESLSRAFQKYPSFQKGKVIRDKKSGKTKGYGFVSFRDSADFIKAMREMNGKYVGNRPIKLRKSNWTDRNIDQVRKKQIEKEKMGLK